MIASNFRSTQHSLSSRPSQTLCPWPQAATLKSRGQHKLGLSSVMMRARGRRCAYVGAGIETSQFQSLEDRWVNASWASPGLAGVPKEERYLSPGVVRRVVARGDANLALRHVLRMLHAEGESWDLFVQDMPSKRLKTSFKTSVAPLPQEYEARARQAISCGLYRRFLRLSKDHFFRQGI